MAMQFEKYEIEKIMNHAVSLIEDIPNKYKHADNSPINKMDYYNGYNDLKIKILEIINEVLTGSELDQIIDN